MVAQTLFFYDRETTGFSSRDSRITQFGGQRTSLDLKKLGEPFNLLIKTSHDILPDPSAVLLTGITPQMTIADGLTEAEFLEIFHKDIAINGTIFVGFNNIRFDDEFIRFLNYRNFHDAYEWHWSNDRSRWDLLDVVRMTRALRPGDIKWSFAVDGSPSNRLEDLASINNLIHEKAHDALSDVEATILLAKLIYSKQPKLFNHLLKMRDKKVLEKFVNEEEKFVYTSGKYSSEFLSTTVVANLGKHPKAGGVIVYDLRIDPSEVIKLSVEDLAERWRHFCKEKPCPHPKIPLKTMQFNRCPAVAPVSVLDNLSLDRLKLDIKKIDENHYKLLKIKNELYEKVIKVLDLLDKKQSSFLPDENLSESALYANFITDSDKKLSKKMLAADKNEMINYIGKFSDARLNSLLPLYIARNFPKLQTTDIQKHYQKYINHKLFEGGEKSKFSLYIKQLESITKEPKLTSEQKYLIDELTLWAESLMP